MRGPNLPSMAWRNLWRNRRRTGLTLSSIAFGTTLAWLFTGLGDANWRQMIDLAARMGGGHVTLQHEEYLDSPTLSRTLVGVTDLAAVALEDPDVVRVVTRISGNMMIASASRNYGAGFIAFDPEAEDKGTLSLLEAVAEGELFDRNGRGGIVLGQKLAENLHVEVGHKVVYTLTDKDGEIVQEAVRVTGMLRTGSPTVDAGLALLPLEYVKRSLRYAPDEAVQIALFLDDQRAAEAVALRLDERVRALPGGRVTALPWHTLQPELAGFIAMKVGGAWIMETIIMLLVAAGIFNTIFIGVMERIREFGILRAIGWSPGQLGRLVLTESALLAAAGLLLGILVTAWPYWYLHTVGVDLVGAMLEDGQAAEVAGIALTTRMYVDIYLENALMIGAAAVAATLLSGLYPAWKAGHVDPAETIRLV
jgi:ABC-type lipoprotein release transport system permease subunit